MIVNKQAGILNSKRQSKRMGTDMSVVIMKPTINHCKDNFIILI